MAIKDSKRVRLTGNLARHLKLDLYVRDKETGELFKTKSDVLRTHRAYAPYPFVMANIEF